MWKPRYERTITQDNDLTKSHSPNPNKTTLSFAPEIALCGAKLSQRGPDVLIGASDRKGKGEEIMYIPPREMLNLSAGRIGDLGSSFCFAEMAKRNTNSAH